jgi:hypothetical protein
MLAATHSNISRICSVENCAAPHVARGLCKNHYRSARKNGLALAVPVAHSDICVADGCGRPSEKRGYCGMHYRRIQRNGSLITVRRQPGEPQPRADGYIDLLINGLRVLQHIAIAEKALGRPLPRGAEVHHFNEVRSDNRNENLVVCPDRQYHMILHARQRALDACGHAGWRKCAYCGEYDDTTNMTGRASRGQEINTFYHKACAARTVSENKAKRKREQT